MVRVRDFERIPREDVSPQKIQSLRILYGDRENYDRLRFDLIHVFEDCPETIKARREMETASAGAIGTYSHEVVRREPDTFLWLPVLPTGAVRNVFDVSRHISGRDPRWAIIAGVRGGAPVPLALSHPKTLPHRPPSGGFPDSDALEVGKHDRSMPAPNPSLAHHRQDREEPAERRGDPFSLYGREEDARGTVKIAAQIVMTAKQRPSVSPAPR